MTKVVNELYAGVFARSRVQDNRFALFQYLWQAPGPQRRLRSGDSQMDIRPDCRRSGVYQWRRKTSRDFCYIENTVQMNLFAALTEEPEAVDQIYNVA